MSSPRISLSDAPATETGGKKGNFPHIAVPSGFKGIGVLYAKDCGPTVEFRVLYESHIPQEIKDIVAELFGIGAAEWQVAPK